MHPDFWEIGASGRCYSRQYVLDVLDQRHRDETIAEEWTVRGFSVERVAPSVYLVSYTLDHLGRTTRRSTLWDNSAGVWKVRFHQGTVMR